MVLSTTPLPASLPPLRSLTLTVTDQANVDWVKHVTGTIAIATAACGGGTEPPSALRLMLAGISASSGDELLLLIYSRTVAPKSASVVLMISLRS